MNQAPLNDTNFYMYCAHHYENFLFTTKEEFEGDLERIKHLKKLITRYVIKNELRENLILNHIIVLKNCFGPEVACKILYLKLKDQMQYIKPFLILLSILPEKIYNVGDELIIDTDMTPMDPLIISRLRKLINVSCLESN